ncbi:MAG: hypothetical protein IT229_12740 [Flavobacteriales bacterium]|nr:hypothetical protein [Flavobacteriales bacterium]
MRRLCILLLFNLTYGVKAQDGEEKVLPYRPGAEVHDELTLLVGYHQGTHGFAELGIGRNIYGVVHHPFGVSYYLGSEVRVDRPELLGVKVGVYGTGGVAIGVQLIQYFEAGEGCAVLRPEIGIGIFKAKLTYAYNIGLASDRLPGINTHMLTLTYAFRVLRLSGDDAKRPLH